MNHTNQTGFASISLLILLAILGGTIGYFAFNPQNALPALAPSPESSIEPSIAPLTATPSPVIRHSPTPSPAKSKIISVSLDKPFTLKKGQIAQVTGSGIEIEITQFYNSPCPKGVQCFWSGVGLFIEYRLNGQVQKGMNLTEAFGYRTSILKTDHQTYADLVYGTKIDQP